MRTLLCFTLAGLLAGPAFAGDPSPAAAPRAAPAPAEAAATRAEIDRLVERINDLSQKLGPGEQVRIIRMQSGPDGHELRLDPDARVRIEREFGKEGRGALPRVHIEGGPTVGIGVVLSANPAAQGVRLAAVTPGGPAAKAGLRSGDVLLSIDGRKIVGNDHDALASATRMLKGLEKGRKLRLGYARAGKGAEVTVVAGDIRRTMMLGGAPGEGAWTLGESEMRDLRMLEPKIDKELRRLLPMMAPCAPGDDECATPALFEAFRWQGLNLAAIDADLGRYFGTRQGVLVLSGGFKGLRSGDVIQKVGDTAVESPRAVMRALRRHGVGAALPVLVLRERKPVVVTITVPEAKALPFLPTAPTPPVPPVPPVAPTPPVPPVPAVPHSRRPGHAVPAPVAPPARPARPATPAPPAPPAPPEDDDDAAVLEGVVPTQVVMVS